MKYTVSLAILVLLGGVDAIKASSEKTLTQRAEMDDAILAGTSDIDVGMIQTKSEEEDEESPDDDAKVSLSAEHHKKSKHHHKKLNKKKAMQMTEEINEQEGSQ